MVARRTCELVNVNYAASTKIMVQTKTRFWEKKGIKGGFSFTDLPIRQIHYPSDPDLEFKKECGIPWFTLGSKWHFSSELNLRIQQ